MNIIKPVVATSYIVTIIVMAAATIIEKCYGNSTSYDIIYGSPWFIAIWAIMAVSALLYILSARLFRRPVVFALHVALLLILAGALTTHIGGSQTNIHLRMGDVNIGQLPFDVKLNKFDIINYPGTQAAMDYRSDISFIEHDGKETQATVSMNNIAEYRGYRFYQSAYDYDCQGTILAVSHDPWGIGITYAGYFMLFASMLLLLVMPNEGFRNALRAVRRTSLIAILWCMTTPATGAPTTLPRDVADTMGNLHVYYNHRICPLQTVAKDFITKMCGRASYDSLTAEQVMAGWLFFPTEWEKEPMIKTKDGERKYMSYDEMTKAHNLGNADYEKINIIRMLLNGQLTRVFPYTDSINGTVWYSQGDDLPLNMENNQWMFIKKSMDYLGEMAVTQDYDNFVKIIAKIGDYQRKQATILPSDELMQAERIYNRLDYSRPLSMVLMTMGIISFIIFTILWSKGKKTGHRLTLPLDIMMGAACAYLICVITLRGYISGHLPLTNGYETMQFMALTAMILTLVMQRSFALVLPFGYLLSGACLLVSMMGESNPQITNLMPVLASPLLSVHVCVIMIAYSLLAFMMLNGITSIIIWRMKKQHGEAQIKALYNISHMMAYPALFLLSIGIFIGAIWANQSWGRYWGWDPKEVWALITMMFYAVMLHRTIVPQMQRPIVFHIYSVVAFLAVLMTYFGVNFLLGGMHSYANS